jgi:histidinol dehydrogenase
MQVNVFELATLSDEDRRGLLLRPDGNLAAAREACAPIIADVRTLGYDAVRRMTLLHDRADVPPTGVIATDGDIKEAYACLPAGLWEAMHESASNIGAFHRAQMPKRKWLTRIRSGVLAGEIVNPIRSVGLYVPGGTSLFASIVLRLGIPARIAGVDRIVVCTPPRSDGSTDPATLVAADMVGVKTVLRIGGPQAIASMAYGLDGLLDPVDKIVGPGGPFVSAAKRLVRDDVDVGTEAGVSEAIILADDGASALNVALDLLVEAEHGPTSPSLLVTHSRDLVSQVMRLLPTLLERVPQPHRDICERALALHGGVVLTASLTESVDFANDYAPEHLELMVADPVGVLARVRNAGEVLLGDNTPVSIGNFVLGPSSVLPTGGRARTMSSASVHDFLKRTSIGCISEEALATTGVSAAIFAQYSQLPAHAMAIRDRESTGRSSCEGLGDNGDAVWRG